MGKNGIAIALLAALGGCVEVAPDDGAKQEQTGDFEDGALLRFRLERAVPLGDIVSCALAPSWTWRYFANHVLVSDGPNPRVPALDLTYHPEWHQFSGEQRSDVPIGYRADDVRLFQGRTFSYIAFWWDDTGNDCASAWEGTIELVRE